MTTCQKCGEPADAIVLEVWYRLPEPEGFIPELWVPSPHQLTPRLGHAACYLAPDTWASFTVDDIVAAGGLDRWLSDLSPKRWVGAHLVRQLERLAMALLAARALAASQSRRTGTLARAISSATRAAVLERDNHRCRRCGVSADHAELVIDHVVPVSRGGGSDPRNLQALCAACNGTKHDQQPTGRDTLAAIR